MSPEPEHTLAVEDAGADSTWAPIQQVEDVNAVEFGDAQRDAHGRPYVYARGIDAAGCEGCQAGDCVQLVTYLGAGRVTVIHDPWVLN